MLQHTKYSSLSSDGALKKRKFDSACDLLLRSTAETTPCTFALITNANGLTVNNNKKRTKKTVESSSFALRRPIAASSPFLLTVASSSKSPSSNSMMSSSNQNEQFNTTTTTTTNSSNNCCIIKPSTYMMTTLHAQGHYVRSRPSLSMPDGFFDKQVSKKEQMASYGQDIVTAVRNRDIGTLRRMWKVDGRSLSCCNVFGESILHMSCRRGFTDVVRFLLDEVKLSLHVVDDCGRTPLHDSMWSCEPNFDIVEMIIGRAPELLFLSDKRGNLPLDYVRKDQYDKWIKFIDRKNETLLPRTDRMKQLFVMAVSTVQANKVNSLIRKNYIDIVRRSNKASSALLLHQQQ